MPVVLLHRRNKEESASYGGSDVNGFTVAKYCVLCSNTVTIGG